MIGPQGCPTFMIDLDINPPHDLELAKKGFWYFMYSSSRGIKDAQLLMTNIITEKLLTAVYTVVSPTILQHTCSINIWEQQQNKSRY